MTVNEATTLAELQLRLGAFGLTECRVTVHLGGRLTAYVGDRLHSVGAYGQGATVAEAIDAALEEWAINTAPKKGPTS